MIQVTRVNKIRLIYASRGLVLAAFFATWQVNIIERGFDPSLIALVVGLSVLISLVMDVPTGIFADKLGHKFSVSLGFLTMLGGFFIPTLSSSFLAVAIAVIVIEVGGAFIDGALETWTADLERERSGTVTNRSYVGIDQITRAGMIVGALGLPAIMQLLGADKQQQWIVLVIACALPILITYGTPKPRVDTPVHKKGESKPWLEILVELKTPAAILLLLAHFSFGFSVSVTSTTLWPWVKDQGISTPILLGLTQASLSLFRIGGQGVWRWFKVTEKPWLASRALLLSAIPAFLFAYFADFKWALILWMLRIAIGAVYYAAFNGMLQRYFAKSKWRASLMSVYGTVSQIGLVAGCGVIALFDLATTTYVFYLSAVFLVVAGVLLIPVKTDE